jgi:TRAP-type C4-dicarboxylate transport system substrate-binding protein
VKCKAIESAKGTWQNATEKGAEMSKVRNSLIFFMIIVLACGIALSGCAPKPAPQVIEWKMQCIYPPADSAYSIQATGLVKRLNEGTNGRLHVTLYPPGALCPEGEMFDALSKGLFDAAVHSASASKGIVPEANMVLGLPASFENNEQFIEFFYDYGGLDLLREAYAEHNILFLMPGASGEFALMTTFPLRSLDDIKGKKLWLSGMFSDVLQSLGASPVTIPAGELYMAMKLGTIDGATWTLPELETAKWKEVVHTVMLPYLLSPVGFEVLVNMDSWNALPADLKQTVENIAKEYAPVTANDISKLGVDACAAAKDYGVNFVTLSDADQKILREAAKKMAWDKFAAKSERCSRIVKLLEDYLKSKGVPLP